MSSSSSDRRSPGEGTIYWDSKRQRWMVELCVGYKPNGQRIRRKASAKDEKTANKELARLIKEYEDGLSQAHTNATVETVIRDFLDYGLSRVVENTRKNYTGLAKIHIIPDLGKRKIRDLTATDVDRWMTDKAKVTSTRTVRLLHSLLSRAVRRAMARDLVKRNVVELTDPPRGQKGRPSKSLTFEQARDLLAAAEGTSMHAYIVVSLLTGARTEELRPLMWADVDLDGQPDVRPASMRVWRSVREDGDTKTKKSRRTLKLPARCVDALRDHQVRQERARQAAGAEWQELGLVFASRVGTELDAANVRRGFRSVARRAGLNPREWTPRELRHSFVSLLSAHDTPLEHISRLVGHTSTATTERIYRKELHPVLVRGAEVMDQIFEIEDEGDEDEDDLEG